MIQLSRKCIHSASIKMEIINDSMIPLYTTLLRSIRKTWLLLWVIQFNRRLVSTSFNQLIAFGLVQTVKIQFGV